MGLTPFLRLVAMTLLLVVGGSASTHAQFDYPSSPYGYPAPAYPPAPGYRDQRAYPPGYYPGKLVQPAQPQQGFSLRRLFGIPDDLPPVQQPMARPRRVVPPPVATARQERPKINATTHVVVFGDVLADFASQGLDDLFADAIDVAVVRKTRGDSGLVRHDAADWSKFIKDALDADRKTTVAVVMLGATDRQALKDGENSVEPFTERWKELYRDRVDALLRTFQDRKIPVVWIGLPPMKNNKLTDDILAMNEIYRESVQRLGGTYVDIWPGFVDEDNRYVMTGPDVDGELAKLRANDGVQFTNAGARKIAHFANADIKRILETAQPGSADSIDAALPAPPDTAMPPSLPVKPAIGPVLPLTRPDPASGGKLISETPKLNGDQAYSVRRALRNGVAPVSRPGRADDFRWPPS
ncbi:SGNH/GDSL hydrolase family protein [Microvirga alba]|nr:SGNH family hydrolase [Microvirga alba]